MTACVIGFLGSRGNFLKKLYFDESGAVAAEYVIITCLLQTIS